MPECVILEIGRQTHSGKLRKKHKRFMKMLEVIISYLSSEIRIFFKEIVSHPPVALSQNYYYPKSLLLSASYCYHTVSIPLLNQEHFTAA